jgi:hypothetical protein
MIKNIQLNILPDIKINIDKLSMINIITGEFINRKISGYTIFRHMLFAIKKEREERIEISSDEIKEAFYLLDDFAIKETRVIKLLKHIGEIIVEDIRHIFQLDCDTERIVEIFLNIVAMKNNILFINEIESHFYYAMYGDIWDMIINLAYKYNCQIIATTHSWEFVRSLIYLTNEKKKDFSLIRFADAKKIGKIGIISTRLNYEDTEDLIKHNIEIRGWY